MKTSDVSGVFKNEASAYTAVHLEMALERVVQVGLRFSKMESYRRDRVAILRALEEKAILPIRGIVQAISPEASKNIRGMDERIIWRMYWDMRNDSSGEHDSIFEILSFLNNNPPHALVFA